MKTIDGHEISTWEYYYLENGQHVLLNECGTTSDSKDMFVVTPFYEGTAMIATGDGGSHHEYSADYEHAGMPVIVNSIFHEPPMEKLHDKYKFKLKEIETLSLTLGLLKLESNKLGSSHSKLIKEIEETAKQLSIAKSTTEESQSKLNDLEIKCSEKRQVLSELEDSIGELLHDTDPSVKTSKSELQRLNKRDFKLNCLEAGGIDNWTYYGDSLEDFRKRYPEG